MSDIYDIIESYKVKNSLTYSDLGKIISVGGDTFRMAMKRKSLSDLRISKLKAFISNEKNEQNNFNNLRPHNLKYKGIEVPINDVAEFVVDNWDEFMRDRLFNATFKAKAGVYFIRVKEKMIK